MYEKGNYIYTTIMAIGTENHSHDALLGPTSIMVVYMDPYRMCCMVAFA